MFTNSFLGYRHLEVETQLEIQPISPEERQRFLKERVSPAKWQQLQGWIDRARQSDYTPFVMWMLAEVCEQVNSSSQLENFSLGEAFREFIRLYQDKLYEEGRISNEDSEAWTFKLKHLASEMLSDETSDNFIVFRNRAINILGSEALLNNLIQHHLLVESRGDGKNRKIEFCHQLLQEYYAAEWLLDRLPELSDEQLKYYFLNYLKWTEAIGLMLGLPEVTEKQALAIVGLALNEVDLMLGAKLAGEVKEDFQPQTVSLLNQDAFGDGREIPKWLKVELLGESKSNTAISFLFDMLDDHSWAGEIASENIPRALRKIGDQAGISALRRAIRHPRWNIVYLTVEVLKEIKSEETVPLLGEALHHDDLSVRCAAVEALSAIGSEAVIPLLREALNDPYENVSGRAKYALRKIQSKLAISDQTLVLQNDQIDSLDDWIDWSADLEEQENIEFSEAMLLELIKNLENEEFSIYWEARKDLQKAGEVAIPLLLQSLQHENPKVRNRIAEILGNIRSKEVIPQLLDILHDSDSNVRRSVAFALGKLGSEAAVPELTQALSYWSLPTRLEAAELLGSLKSEAAIPALINTLQDEDWGVRSTIAEALGRIGSETAVPALINTLNQDEHKAVSCGAAIALSKIASEASILAFGTSLEG